MFFLRFKEPMENLFYSKPWQPNFSLHPYVTESPLECVIIEPRSHANLKAAIHNMSCMLPYASLTILHSKDNEAFIKDHVFEGQVYENINMRCFTESNINKYEYNEMLCSPEFWSQFASHRVLFFQTDSGMRYNRILRFMQYDYIGAPWHWQIYGDTNIQIGNGGFSLRNPRIMQDISRSFVRNSNYHDKTLGEPEDIFFARTLVHINDAQLPSYNEASMFSVEHNIHEDPMAFHQAYSFHPQSIVQRWMTETDPCQTSRLLTIKDAWLESEGGRQWTPPNLRSWLSLGIGPGGFCMPKDTLLSCVSHDIHYGYKKWLMIRFEDNDIRIPLYQNRCRADINVTP